MNKRLIMSILLICAAIVVIIISFGVTSDSAGCGGDNVSESDSEMDEIQNLDEDITDEGEETSLKYLDASHQNSCLSNDKENIFRSMWKNKKAGYINDMVSNLRKDYMSASLYFIQHNLQGALEKAIIEKDAAFIEEIADITLIAYDYLTEVNSLQLHQGTADNGSWQTINLLSGERFKIWKDYEYNQGRESTLYSSQFIYFLSRISNAITLLPSKARTSLMLDFIKKYNPIITSTLDRWIFSNYGPFSLMNAWGCYVPPDNGKNRYNLSEYVDLLKTKSFIPHRANLIGVCNYISDIEMWIGSSVAEIIMANKNDKKLVALNNITSYKKFVDRFRNLLKSRITKEKVADFNGRAVSACGFNHGYSASSHYTTQFAGYTDPVIPVDSVTGELSMAPVPDPNLGWDFGHAIRFVRVFDTLYEYGKRVKSGYPNLGEMKCLANQVAYKVSTKDTNLPLFNNYMNGANGWYNILSVPTSPYSDAGTGYGPYDNSYVFLSGGWNSWTKYNTDLRILANRMWDIIENATVEDGTNNNSDGWVNGGVTWLDNGGRDGSGAFNFDGVDDKIGINLTNFQFQAQKISVEAWVYPEDYQTTTVQGIVDKFNTGGSWSLLIGWGYFRFRIRDNNATFDEVYYPVSEAGGNNNWYHLVGTYDITTGSMKLYVNGELKHEKTSSVTMENANYPLFLGFAQNNAVTGTSAGYFKGKIDDVKIYNRVLEVNEVVDHYNGIFNNNTKLIASYNFNDSFIVDDFNHLRNHYGTNTNHFERVYRYDNGVFNLQDSQTMFAFVSSFCGKENLKQRSERISYTIP